MFRCMKKGGAPCRTCPYVKQNKVIKATATATTVELTRHHTCQDENLVYIVECSKCRLQYIGETKHTAEKRWAEHLGYVRNKRLDQATGAHFNLPGHNIDHMTFSVLEKITSNNPQYRKARESHYIEKFNLKYAGMNVKR